MLHPAHLDRLLVADLYWLGILLQNNFCLLQMREGSLYTCDIQSGSHRLWPPSYPPLWDQGVCDIIGAIKQHYSQLWSFTNVCPLLKIYAILFIHLLVVLNPYLNKVDIHKISK
jgi:hypothetical protein